MPLIRAPGRPCHKARRRMNVDRGGFCDSALQPAGTLNAARFSGVKVPPGVLKALPAPVQAHTSTWDGAQLHAGHCLSSTWHGLYDGSGGAAMGLCQLSFPRRHRRPDRPRTSRVAALYGSARRVSYLDVCSRPSCALVPSMSTNVSTPCAVFSTKSTRQKDSLLSSPDGKLSRGRGKSLSVDARCLFIDRCVLCLSTCL